MTREIKILIKTRLSHGFHNTYALGRFILLLINRLGSVAKLTRAEDLVIKRVELEMVSPKK